MPRPEDKPHPHDPDYQKPGKGLGREDAPGQNKPEEPTDPSQAPHPDQTLPGDLDEDEEGEEGENEDDEDDDPARKGAPA